MSVAGILPRRSLRIFPVRGLERGQARVQGAGRRHADVVSDEAQQELDPEDHRQGGHHDGSGRRREARLHRSRPVPGAEDGPEEKQGEAGQEIQRGDAEVSQEVVIGYALGEVAQVEQREGRE